MNKHYHSEIGDIFESYEWLIRERLVALDHLSRKMFTDMSLARIKHPAAVEYVRGRIMEMILEIVREGDESDCAKRSNSAKPDKALKT